MPDTKECTLMFYFASDNPLAISIVSQLKAIKAAGYHPEANVIVQFDPFTEGIPTHLFDVNLVNKLKSRDRNIGFDNDGAFVRNLVEDKLWSDDQKTHNDQPIKTEIRNLLKESSPNSLIYDPPTLLSTLNGNSEELSPRQSLEEFLKFCATSYPANHYMLFILGHGVVVGNDVFLFDENAEEHTMKLNALGTILKDFKDRLPQSSSFDLVGFHSCSVSSLEVAYELKDTAKYMLASQGTAFVGSWPYRQILIRIFRDLGEAGRLTRLSPAHIREMLVKIFFYCLHNSTDFLLAGYPFDLSLINLKMMPRLKPAMTNLSESLIKGLSEPQCRNLIILAHWESQSFYQEMYTDIYDFCFCLKRLIDELAAPSDSVMVEMRDACEEVIEQLEKAPPLKIGRADAPPDEHIIVCSENAGPESQYSHGLSVYFPWSKPSEDRHIIKEYEEYKWSSEFLASSRWLDFLNEYFEKTKRGSRKQEEREENDGEEQEENEQVKMLRRERALLEDEIALVYKQQGPHGNGDALDRSKTDPKDPTGGDCNCPSIKNYPLDMRARSKRRKETVSESLKLTDTFVTALE